ncbi:uncharacterized protein LOC143956890 isoform X2 [Lithobates pipiens]
MEDLQILSMVLCVSGLFGLGTVEGLTEGWNITVICTNESNSENQIQLLCNLELFICSSMDASQEKFTIDQSSIRLPGSVLKARGEGAPNSLPANYSCQNEDWVVSTVFSTVPDPNTTAVPVSHPGTISWHKSSNNQPAKPREEIESHLPKEKRKRNSNSRKPNRNGNENSNRRRDPENKGRGKDKGGKSEDGNRRGEAEGDDGKDSDKRSKKGYSRLSTGITVFAIIATLTVILLLLVAFCLHRWKKRIEQRTLKAGGTSAQKLQEGDCEKKVVTGHAAGTNSGNPVLPSVYNSTGHIYQEIEYTPPNSAEVKNNPLYVPSQEQQLGSQDPPPSNEQYSLLQLPV